MLYDKMYICCMTKWDHRCEVYNQSIGVKSNSYSALLLPVIILTFPSCLFISRTLEEEWDVVDLLEHLGDEIWLRRKYMHSSVGNTMLVD